MTKLEALEKTRDRWMRFKPERRLFYGFGFSDCALCEYTGEYECGVCPWYLEYGFCYEEGGWIDRFACAKTDEDAEMWRDAVVGMLEYLIEEEKK